MQSEFMLWPIHDISHHYDEVLKALMASINLLLKVTPQI